MSQTRAAYKAGVSATIFTNTLKLIKGNTVRDKLNLLADSAMFKDTDADQPGGYLSIDAGTGAVDASFIKSASPTGLFLRDDGTFAAVGGSQDLAAVLTTGNSTAGIQIAGFADTDNSAFINSSVAGSIYFESLFTDTGVNTRASMGVYASGTGAEMTAEDLLLSETTGVQVTPGAISVTSDAAAFRGLVYGSDISANFVNESLVSKRYVDAAVGSSSITIPSTRIPFGSGSNTLTTSAGFTNTSDPYTTIINLVSAGYLQGQINIGNGLRLEGGISGSAYLTHFPGDMIYRPGGSETVRMVSGGKTLFKDSGRAVQIGGWVGLESLYGGIYFADTPTSVNYALTGNNTATNLNAVSAVQIQVNNSTIISVSSGVLINGPLIMNTNGISVAIGAAPTDTWIETAPSTSARSSLKLRPGVANGSITSPAAGMINHDNAGDLYFYNGSAWKKLNSGGGVGKAIVRCVYLVGDSSDVTNMGGTAENTYNTWAAAYTAAVYLQGLLGGATRVGIVVGNITAAQAGDLTLSSDLNTNIVIIGMGREISQLGNIIATNASGNGRKVGGWVSGTGTTSDNSFKIYGVSIGNINTTATGTSGNGGTVGITGGAFQIGNITVGVTHASNTSGYGGLIDLVAVGALTGFEHSGAVIGDINTSVIGASANAGALKAAGCTIGNIITAQNSRLVPTVGSQVARPHIELLDCSTGTISCQETTSYIVNTNERTLVLKNTRTGDVSLKLHSINFTTDNVVIEDSIVDGVFTLTGTISEEIRSVNSRIKRLVNTNINASLLFTRVILSGDGVSSTLDGLGDGTFLKDVIITNRIKGSSTTVINSAVATVKNILSSNVRMQNVKVFDGKVAMSNGTTGVALSAIDCYFEKRISSLIDLEKPLTDAATITWDVSLNETARVTIAGNRTLVIKNAVEGRRYRLRVTQGTGGSRTLTLPDSTYTYSGGAGAITLSTAVGSADDIVFQFDGLNLTAEVRLNATNNGVARTDIVQSETFSATPANWTFTGDFLTDNSTGLFPLCNVAGSSGGYYMMGGGSAGFYAPNYAILKLNTVGYTNLKLKWNALRSQVTAPDPTCNLAYSLDGITYTAITFTDVAIDSAWHAVTPVSLPSVMSDKEQVYLRWEIVETSYSLEAFDDVIITGTP